MCLHKCCSHLKQICQSLMKCEEITLAEFDDNISKTYVLVGAATTDIDSKIALLSIRRGVPLYYMDVITLSIQNRTMCFMWLFMMLISIMVEVIIYMLQTSSSQ